MIGIYMIRNKVNNKKYIGQAIDIKIRWNEGHIGPLRKGDHSNTHLQSAWNRYGEENFKFSIVMIFQRYEIQLLNKYEKYWIAKYKTDNPKHGYNKTDGGSNGRPNEATKEKMRSATKEIIHDIRNYQTGQKMPEEVYSKIRESKKKNFKQFSQKEINNILEKRKNGELYIDIANYYNVCYNTIRKIVIENNPDTKQRKVTKTFKRKSFKLSDEQVREIRKLLKQGETYKFISEKFDVSSSTIKRIRIGTYYNWVKGE